MLKFGFKSKPTKTARLSKAKPTVTKASKAKPLKTSRVKIPKVTLAVFKKTKKKPAKTRSTSQDSKFRSPKEVRAQLDKDLTKASNVLKSTSKKTRSTAKKAIKTGKKATRFVDKLMSGIWK